MSFLQPWMLFALPAIALPILIHLIHKRRHRVVEWGAMMFLLQGVRMSRGRQKLRQILLLIVRTLAVLTLVLGIGRPIAGGWLGGLGGGRPDTVLVLLDRSASMNELVPGSTESKLEVGVRRIARALANVEANSWACIDSASEELTELVSPADLADLPVASGTSHTADLPAMLERAAEHLRINDSGRAEIWICSDAQIADWRPEDGRWRALADALLTMPAGVRVNVLAFTERAPDNLSVRVEQARRRVSGDGAELVLDLVVTRTGGDGDGREVPVEVDLGGAATVVPVELEGGKAELRGHRIELDDDAELGWGSVAVPDDTNPSDDRFFFTYGEANVQETVVVAEDDGVGDILRIAAESPAGDGVTYRAEVLRPEDASAHLDLGSASLLLWQAPLPTGDAAEEVARFVAGGGHALFLPPESTAGGEVAGVSWGALLELGSSEAPAQPTTWRAESDLLRKGADGVEVPVDELRVRRLQEVRGDFTSLARFGGGETLLARAPTDAGGVYFFATQPTASWSNTATQGLVLVALVHRSLEVVAASASAKGQAVAGAFAPVFGEWRPVDGSADLDGRLLGEVRHHAGVLTDGERFVALNRDLEEDRSATLDTERLLGLLPDVDVALVEGTAEAAGLVEEIWRVFLVVMLIALIGEALLCITESSGPELTAREGAGTGGASVTEAAA